MAKKLPSSQNKTLAASQSLDERIASAIEAFKTDVERRKQPGYGFPMPSRRQLNVGDKVVLGGLEDVVVIRTELEGLSEHVIVSFTQVDHNYGRPIRHENRIRVVHLSEVYKRPESMPAPLEGLHLSSTFKKLRQTSRVVESLIFEKTKLASDTPDFQRGYVWNLADKQRLILSVLQGKPLGAIIIARDESYRTRDYFILDGKQRVNALCEFYCGCFPVNGRYFDELSAEDIGTFTQSTVAVYYLNLESVSRRELLELFLLVNEAGVPQTEEHLASVRAELNSLKD